MTVNLAWRNAIAATDSAWFFGFDPAAETGFVEYLPLELIARFQIDYRPPQRLAPDRFTQYPAYDPLPGRLLNAFTDHMQAACKSGALPYVRAPNPAISNGTIQQVSVIAFAAWLALQGEEPSAHITAWFTTNGVATPAAPPASANKGKTPSADQSNPWPWGSHHTESLGHLEAAAQRFWVRYDPLDATTAPTNAEVSQWLQETRKVSQTKAHAIASMLRPDDLPTGPRT